MYIFVRKNKLKRNDISRKTYKNYRKMKVLPKLMLICISLISLHACNDSSQFKTDKDKLHTDNNALFRGFLPVDTIADDTVFYCNQYGKAFQSGLILNESLAKKLDMHWSPDSTVTLIKAIKNKEHVLLFFTKEYSNLAKVMVNIYASDGKLTDSMEIPFKCGSDARDNNRQEKRIQSEECSIVLRGDTINTVSTSTIYTRTIDGLDNDEARADDYTITAHSYIFSNGHFKKIK